MAKINTLEKLEKKIDRDISWRKKELTFLKSQLILNKSKNLALINTRICATFLYAHWEGLIKNSSNYYLEYVSSQNIPIKHYESNFLAIYLKDHFQNCANSKKPSFRKNLITAIINRDLISDNFQSVSTVNTLSNLNVDQFHTISEYIGVDVSILMLDKVLIDEKLLKWRNSIAHGNQEQIDIEEYIGLHSYILEKMDEYITLIKQYSKNRLYLYPCYRDQQ